MEDKMKDMKINTGVEMHITVDAADDLAKLPEFAKENDLKFLHIVLPRGANPSQPMVTWRGVAMGAAARALSVDIAARLWAGGFTVRRVKLEEHADGPSAPRTPGQAAASLGGGRCFEHHFKIFMLPAHWAQVGADIEAMLAEHGAAHSANASRHDALSVTQRCFGVTRHEAGRRLSDLLRAADGMGCSCSDIEREFVVEDDNPALDAGWFDNPV